MSTLQSWIEVGVLVGLLYAPVTLGLMWAFRSMNYPDLTCEGSFMISGAVSIAVLNGTGSITLAIITGIGSSAIAGCLTACLHVYLRISRLLSGIITWALLFSVTIRILGGLSNLAAKRPTFFTVLNPDSSARVELGIAFAMVSILSGIVILVANSRLGRVMRAFGDQPRFSVGLGYSSKILTILGLTTANALIGASGVVLCHFRQVCDVNMSMGVLIAGLASLVIGEAVFDSKKIWQYTLTVVAGTIIYNLAISAFYFEWGIGLEKIFIPSDVRMISGLLLLIPAAIIARKRSRYKLFASEW